MDNVNQANQDASPNVPFSLPAIGREEEEAVLRVLRSGWLTTGKEALAFENEFAHFVGAKHAFAVNSATSGLLLAYDAAGVGSGTSIVTTPYTFASTALAAEHLGARIIYADIEKDGYNIDADAIDAALTAAEKNGDKVRAVVPVHIAGKICDMDAIEKTVMRHNQHKSKAIPIIEDAAHAFPSLTQNGFAGTLGDIGVYSFYVTKPITTGEGGMICTNNDAYAERMKIMRLHGIDRPVWNRYTSDKASWQYDVVQSGWKCNLPDILAAIGREQLKKANALFEAHKKIAARYNEAFSNYDFLQLPPDGTGNAWHLYLLRITPEKLRITRDEYAQKLQERGIGVSVHFIPHFRLTHFQKKYGITAEQFPNAEKQFSRTITLSFYPTMTDAQIERVIQTVIEIGCEQYAK